MAIQIKLKNSVVQDSTPSTSDLPEVGEIALNANINSIGGFMRASDNTIVKIFGAGSLSTPTATTTVSGISELATNTETTTGTATNRVVTPAGLNAVTVAERTTSNTNYVAKAGSTLTGVLTMPNGSNSAPAINFGDSDSGIFGGTNTVSLAAGGTTRLTADTGVSVVGTLAVTGAITSTDDLTIPDKIIHSGDTNTAIRFPAADTVSVETGGSEAIRVDSSQRLFVGVTSGTVGGFSPKLFVERADSSASIGIFRSAASNFGPFLLLGKSRASSLGGSTIVQDDDRLGQIAFFGADGTDRNTQAAEIKAEVDGTPGSNDMPGRLVFSTTADGASSPTARLTIDSSGRLLLGTSTAGNTNQVIYSDGTNDNKPAILFQNSLTGTGSSQGFYVGSNHDDQKGYLWNYEDEVIVFGTNNTERARIDSSGRMLLGTTTEGNSSADDLTIAGSGNVGISIRSGTSSEGAIYFSDATSGNAEFDGFIVYNQNDRELLFGTQQATRMRVNSSGNVGIGMTPNAKLSVNGDLFFGGNASIEAGSSSGSLTLVGGSTFKGGRIVLGGGSGDDDIRFTTSGASTTNTERMRLGSSGEVYIGTSNWPTGSLGKSAGRVMMGNEGSLTIWNETNSAGGGGTLKLACKEGSDATRVGFVNLVGGTENTSDRSSFFKIQVSNSSGSGIERMRIDSSGNLVLGSSTASGALTVVSTKNAESGRSNASNYHLHLRNNENDNGEAIGISFGITSSSNGVGASILHERDAAGSQGSLQFYTNGDGSNVAERMRIASDGKVGINIAGSDNTSPVRNLDIADSSGAILRLISSDDSLGASERVGEIEFFTDDDDSGHVSSFIKAIADPSDAFGRRGALTFGTRSDSGNGTEKIRILPSGGITFNGDTAAANALDDYEEGTWSPTITQGFSGNAPTYLDQNGAYVKIGKQVTVWFFLRFNAFTTNGGQILVSLPITASTGSHGYFGAVSYHSIANAAQSHTYIPYLFNATNMRFYAGAGYGLSATSGTSQANKYIIGGFTYQVP